MRVYAVYDQSRGEYFQSEFHNGWFGPLSHRTRLYSAEANAQRTINHKGHHVTYPGDRELMVVALNLEVA